MRTFKMTLSYDGSGYAGFQRQKRDLAVQNVVEEKLAALCAEPVHIAGSGRTDAGVHARCQVVSFSTEGRIPRENLFRALNRALPQNIRVLDLQEVDASFHARKSACWKRYEYRVQFCPVPDPFHREYCWQLEEPLDLAAMNEAAGALIGTYDFSGFQSAGSAPVSPVKTIYEVSWEKVELPAALYRSGPLGEGGTAFSSGGGEGLCPAVYVFRIAGNGFVYHMVRNLVWSLVRVGQGRKTPAEFAAELEMARGEFENAPAPAQGLYLDYVGYRPYEEETGGTR